MKRIVISVFLSILGPGLGQIYNRDIRKGVALLLASTFLFLFPMIWLVARVQPLLPKADGQQVSQEAVQAAALQVLQKDKFLLNFISFAFLGLWAYAITQAYFRAKEINEAEAAGGPGPDDGEPPDE